MWIEQQSLKIHISRQIRTVGEFVKRSNSTPLNPSLIPYYELRFINICTLTNSTTFIVKTLDEYIKSVSHGCHQFGLRNLQIKFPTFRLAARDWIIYFISLKLNIMWLRSWWTTVSANLNDINMHKVYENHNQKINTTITKNISEKII